MRLDRRQLLAGMAASPLAAKVLPFKDVTVFEARKIVTMERSYPNARFMAVADGTVLGLAQSMDALAPWTEGRNASLNREFADKVIFPGLVDPHIHPMQSAVMLNVPFLAPDDWKLPSGNWHGVSGQDAYRARLRNIVDSDPTDPLVIWGQHELFHGPVTRTVLDEIAPDRPLFIWQRSFHDIYANTAGLRYMQLDTAEAFSAALEVAGADPEHADFEIGMFSETALGIAIDRLRPVLLSPERMRKGFAGLIQMMQDRGVTTTADMATGIFARFDVEAGIIKNAFNSPNSNARVLLVPIAAELDARQLQPGEWFNKAHSDYAGGNILVDKRVKLFADGAFFAQNMRMGPPGYTDGHLGKWLTEPEVLYEQIAKYQAAGFALNIHVNGDEGAEEVLAGLEASPHGRNLPVTLEHLGYCTEAQLRRIAAMGLMVSAQPNYIRVLGEAYSRTGFGPDRAALMNRLGSIERQGIPLGLHSDFNMAPIDPFYLAWIAQTREGLDGVERAPDEQVGRDKALRSITIEAAQVVGLDHLVGSLAAGKKADFVVLDHDPYEMATAAMKEMPIAATVFEGRV